MHDHSLKEYQRQSLECLAAFCDEVQRGLGKSRRPVHDAFHAVTGRNFLDVPQMPEIPYVCLRVPTGGGKTLIAAHAVGTIAKRLSRQDLALCLWVTPSTTIRDQTLRALRDRQHPFHLALKENLGTRPEVLTLEEAYYAANRATLTSRPVVIVTTIQSYRIDEPGNRRIYDDDGYLMDNFRDLPELLRQVIKEPETGLVKQSLANVMKLRGPIVIMDEAHNARTRISFDSLARMCPLAVLELTATPIQEHDPANDTYASNVLHAVSALQLKREGMIKLPVDLESRENWLEVLALTVERRTALAARAAVWSKTSGRYVRPIALIQAQPRSKTKETHTADKVKEALIQRLSISAESIRIATGDLDDLGAEDLSKPDCPVEYVITVDKLREGWDCPFAYVLGSVGNVATETAVEQLLGRILRMPQATPTGVPELDRAYAIVQSEDVARTAQNLADSMVNRCGFDRDSIGDALRVRQRLDTQRALFFSAIPVSAEPNLTALTAEVKAKVNYERDSGKITVLQPLTRDDALALQQAVSTPADRAAVETYWQQEREVGTTPKRLDEYAKPMCVPQLAVRDGQRLFRFDPIELEEFEWNLDKCDAKFTVGQFSDTLHVGDHVRVDVDTQGAVKIGGVEEVILRQLSFLPTDENWEKVELVRWLDREIHRGGQNAGLTAAESQAWLIRVADYLVAGRGLAIPMLVRKRHELADLLHDRIVAHGRVQVRNAAHALFRNETERRLETTFEMSYEMLEQDHAPSRRYHGPFGYPKHAFDLIGEMGDEESQCAKKIDDHPNVRRWLRNESINGYSLPLSPGRFFPDFIVELEDWRTAIVEYKGPHLAHDPKELHKKVVGEMWAARSDGKCVFVWVVDRDWATLSEKLAFARKTS